MTRQPAKPTWDPVWVHRQALQICTLLPDDIDHAIAVLDRARFLLNLWRAGNEEQHRAELVTPTFGK